MARYDGRQCAHVWAQQRERRGESGGALRFEGETLYSYAEPIGRFVEHRGRRAVLLSSRSWSITTSKHQGFAGAAVHGLGLPVFRVPFMFPRDPAENLRALLEAAAEAHAKIGRARSRYTRDGHIGRAAEAFEAARDYAAFYGLRFKAEGIEQAAAEVEAARQRAKRKQAREAAAQRKRDATAFEAWRTGEGYYPPSSYATDEAGGAYLRIKGDELQTSLRASVPLAHAVRAFRFIKLVRERGRAWRANGHSVRVGHFTVSEITTEGDIRAGCHLIRWPEIERAARAAGVFTEAPSDEAAEPAGAPV